MARAQRPDHDDLAGHDVTSEPSENGQAAVVHATGDRTRGTRRSTKAAPTRADAPLPVPTVRDGWLEFSLPAGADADAEAVRASIRNVHRQAYTDLAVANRCRWKGYTSVESKLRIAAEALQHGARDRASELVTEAQATYREQLRAQRKMWYLWGVVIGVGMLALLQLGLQRSTDSLANVISERFAFQIIMFAGMGTLASVLTRLSQFRIDVYATRPLVVISGISRPLVAVFVAFGVYVAFKSNLESITINGTDLSNAKDATFIYLTAAFLCGFSERFGKDVIGKAATALGGAGAPAPPPEPD